MTAHLSGDELIDAVDGGLRQSRRSHLAACASCQQEAERMERLLREVRSVAVPEPSPLFWDHLSRRVHAAIAAEHASRTAWWPEWLRTPVLVPLAAIALVIVVLAATLSRPAPAVVTPIVSVTGAEDGIDLSAVGEQEWHLVAEIVGDVPLAEAADAGIVIRPGDAERAAEQLTAGEQRELLRLLQEEIDKVGD